MKKNVLLLLLIFSFSTLPAQKKNKFLIGYEMGTNFLEGKTKESWFIRQDADVYSDYHPSMRNIDGHISHLYFGIKPEISLFQNKLSFTSGVRLNIFDLELKGTSPHAHDSYFFLRYLIDDTSMHFTRINSASEKTYYIGVPLETRYIFLQSSWLGFYIKAGIEANLKLNHNHKINFTDKEMKPYEEEVWSNVSKKVNPYYASVYGALGCRMHVSKMIDFNLEITTPHNLTSNNFSIVDTHIFNGVQMSIQIPLEKRDSFNVLFK